MQENSTKRLDWTWDETILALNLYFECNGPNLGSVGKTHPAVIELSDFLRGLPIHDERDRKENFRNPVGVAMKLSNFLRWDPAHTDKGLSGLPNGSILEGEVWDSFASNRAFLASVADAIRENFKNPGGSAPDFDNQENITATEGALLIKVHHQRERSSKLVKRKKADTLKRLGKLECEVCGFDFAEKYGPDLGLGTIDCHHKTPLSELKPDTKTTLRDLALVCPNCHRILHRGGNGQTMSVETLATALRSH